MGKAKDTTDIIERKMLLQVLIVSLAGILVYIFNSLFIVKSSEIFYQSLGAFLLYTILYVVIYFPGNFLVKKRIVSLILFLSVISGFFVLGGLKGIACIDIVNMVLYTSILYRGRERIYYTGILFVTLFVLSYLQINFPYMIKNNNASDPEWILALNILVRIALSFNIGFALREAYSKEQIISNNLVLNVNSLNNEILAQNEELKSIQEDLTRANNNLEILVKERTKKLELQNETLITYSYMNSHIFRGPVCRLLGLLQLMKVEKDEEGKVLLQQYLYQEVESIDNVVKDISKILYEKDEELLEDIRSKAKKLYQL